KLPLTPSFKVQVERGTFADKLGKVLDELDSNSSQIAPTFALIDPFGFSGIPYALIERKPRRRDSRLGQRTGDAHSLLTGAGGAEEQPRKDVGRLLGNESEPHSSGYPNISACAYRE